MKPMTPKGLEQSPQKPITIPKLQKVEETKLIPIDDTVNLIDVGRLGIRKKIENFVFNQLQINSGKAVTAGGFTIGGGLFASINWVSLMTGNVFEILKLVFAVGSILLGWFWKK